MISLSKKVVYQKRTVYDIFMMFGDVGGLNDFLGVLLSSVFGLFSDSLLNGAMVKKMFQSVSPKSYGNQPSRSYQIENLKKTYKGIEPIKISKLFLLLRACTYEKCPRDKKKKKLIKTGTNMLENALDVVSIMRLSRSF